MILLRVSLLLLILLLLPEWYIYKVYVRRWRNGWLRRLYMLPGLILLLGLLVFIVANEMLRDGFGIYLIVTLCVVVPKAVFVLFSLLLRAAGRLVK